jgi:HK97 family phage portal protein
MLDQYTAGDPEFKKVFETVIKNQLKSFIENDNAVYPQFRGQDLQEFASGNAKDTSDIIAMRKEVFEVVAQALKIPQSMMNGNITNMNEIVKVYLSICIDPLADMIGEEISRKYYSFDEWKAGSYVKVDTSCINHIDIFEAAESADKAIASGLTNIDEMRDRIGWEQLGTEFSTVHWMTKNYALIEDVLNQETMEGGE